MSIVICLVVALIVALIYTSALKGQLKSVTSQHGAAQYEKQGSFKLTNSQDKFLYKKLEKTKKNNPKKD